MSNGAHTQRRVAKRKLITMVGCGCNVGVSFPLKNVAAVTLAVPLQA